MKISIVTPVYNARATVGRTIASVRDQRHPHIEHIVVDGASTDGTTELLQSETSSIDLLISEPDRGIYDALNKGILRATGDVVGILHADDFYPDDRVLSDVAAAFEASAAEVVLGDVIFVSRDDPDRIVRRYRADVWSPERFVSGWMPPHPGFFVRRVHHQRLGLYKTDYAIGADYDLLIRFLYTARLSYAYLGRVAVHMRRGGISTRGLKSNWVLNREIVRACEENGLRTSMARLLLRYPAKMLELRAGSGKLDGKTSNRRVPRQGSFDGSRNDEQYATHNPRRMRSVPTTELKLLLCVGMREEEQRSQSICNLLASSHPDWNALIQLAHRHGLIPLLFRALSNLNSSRMPPGVIATLHSQCDAIRFQNLYFARELIGVLRAFEAAGILATPYKGPALAAFLYGDVAMRQSCDIDVLVRPGDALMARRVLLSQGYISKERVHVHAEPAYARLHRQFSFTSRERRVLVELTWRVVPWYWRLPEIPDAAWGGIGGFSFAGVSVPWFAAEDLLFVLYLHGCKHKWESLKWIFDIAELLRISPNLNWTEVMDNARRSGAGRMLALSLFLANDLLDAPVPEAVLEIVRATPAVESLAAEVCNNLFAPNAKPMGILAELSFLGRAADHLETKLCCGALIPAYFLLHRVVRPGVSGLRRVFAG